jgi:hypothetical protein
MSAIGPKRTFPLAPPMSAFGGKADMTVCGNPLLRSLLGVKRTWVGAPHMSAFDSKRTFAFPYSGPRRELSPTLSADNAVSKTRKFVA